MSLFLSLSHVHTHTPCPILSKISHLIPLGHGLSSPNAFKTPWDWGVCPISLHLLPMLGFLSVAQTYWGHSLPGGCLAHGVSSAQSPGLPLAFLIFFLWPSHPSSVCNAIIQRQPSGEAGFPNPGTCHLGIASLARLRSPLKLGAHSKSLGNVRRMNDLAMINRV